MIILCPSCKELMRANEQERHNERECPERTLNCKYCKEAFQLKSIKVSPRFQGQRPALRRLLKRSDGVSAFPSANWPDAVFRLTMKFVQNTR